MPSEYFENLVAALCTSSCDLHRQQQVRGGYQASSCQNRDSPDLVKTDRASLHERVGFLNSLIEAGHCVETDRGTIHNQLSNTDPWTVERKHRILGGTRSILSLRSRTTVSPFRDTVISSTTIYCFLSVNMSSSAARWR